LPVGDDSGLAGIVDLMAHDVLWIGM